MRSFRTLFAKELLALFGSPIAYALIAVFLLIVGYQFAAFLIVERVATLVHVFIQCASLLLLIIPLLTMRLLAEERRLGTLELLLTSPATEGEIVLAKFCASLALIAVMLALTLVYPLVLQRFGEPDWGPIYSGYLGLLLLSSALIAIGLAVSGLTANQIVAATISVAISVLLWMAAAFSAVLPYPFDMLAATVSLQARIAPLAGGALHLTDIGFFVVVTALGLFLAVRSLARR